MNGFRCRYDYTTLFIRLLGVRVSHTGVIGWVVTPPNELEFGFGWYLQGFSHFGVWRSHETFELTVACLGGVRKRSRLGGVSIPSPMETCWGMGFAISFFFLGYPRYLGISEKKRISPLAPAWAPPMVPVFVLEAPHAHS